MQFSQQAMQRIVDDPSNADTIREGQKLLQAIMKRSTTDAAFRRQLVSAAIAAHYREMFGKELPAEASALDIRFVEPVSEFTYVLPDAVDTEAELSETELASVAGGLTPTIALVGTYLLGVGSTIGVVWAVHEITN